MSQEVGYYTVNYFFHSRRHKFEVVLVAVIIVSINCETTSVIY